MGNEVEVKFRVTPARAAEMRTILESMAEASPSTVTQVDQYFETGTKTSLRIRTSSDMRQKILTVKGPTVEKNGVKTREEIEMPMSDYSGQTERMLELLGFQPSVCVKKERFAASVNGFEVAVDEVQGAGTFVEIEAKSSFAASIIENMIAHLFLNDAERVKEGYKDLVQ